MDGRDLHLIQRVVDLMNEALEADQTAISNLINHRVPCNETLADHPTIQCGIRSPAALSDTTVGLLGILNGICGIKPDGYGYVYACMDGVFNVVIKFEGQL